MSGQEYGTVHASALMGKPTVRAIKDHPGWYVIYLNDANQFGATMHVTAEQWAALDAAVRSGMAAAVEAVSA